MENGESVPPQNNRVVYIGQFFFALGIIGIGIQHFIYSNFVPVILPWWPPYIPGRSSGTYFIGALLISAGALIIMRKQPRIAATRLGMILLLLLIFTIIIQLTQNNITGLLNPGIWTNTFKEFALCGSAFVVAASLPVNNPGEEHQPSRVEKFENKIMSFRKFPLAIMVLVFGIGHFVYTRFVSTLVPTWIPWHVFWTYFAGAALIASSTGIILNIKARLAATLLGVMLFLWVLILHIPRAFAASAGSRGNEWTSVFEALAFSGIAFILGQTIQEKQK